MQSLPMTPMIIPPRRPQAFATSLCIHLVLGGLLFLVAREPAPSPSGVRLNANPTFVELSDAPTRPVPLRPLMNPNGDVKVAEKISPPAHNTEPNTEPKTKEVQPATEQIGDPAGTESTGNLGVANGFSASDLEHYLFELRVLIANKKVYPAQSKRLRETGRVIVKFEIDRSGRIEQPVLREASQYSRLNEAALQLVSRLEYYKPFPEGQSNEKLAVEIPIDYILN